MSGDPHPNHLFGFPGLTWMEPDPVRDGEAHAQRQIRNERIMADAEATAYLAEMNCPDDVVEFGRRHNIPTLAEVTWNAGFMAGWRMACARRDRATIAREEET